MNDKRPWYSLIDLHHRLSQLPDPFGDLGRLALTRLQWLVTGAVLLFPGLILLLRQATGISPNPAPLVLGLFVLGIVVFISVSLARLMARHTGDASVARSSQEFRVHALVNAVTPAAACLLQLHKMISGEGTAGTLVSCAALPSAACLLIAWMPLGVLLYLLGKVPPRKRTPLRLPRLTLTPPGAGLPG